MNVQSYEVLKRAQKYIENKDDTFEHYLQNIHMSVSNIISTTIFKNIIFSNKLKHNRIMFSYLFLSTCDK